MGNVRFKETKQLLWPGNNNRGYLTACLCTDNKWTNKYIHRLVALAFIPNPDNKNEVDHIDNNRLNNKIDNLRWATRTENQRNKGISKLNTSGIVGVRQYNDRWRAQISLDGTHISLPLRANKEDAILDRQFAVNTYYKDFAHQSEHITINDKIKYIINNHYKDIDECVSRFLKSINNKRIDRTQKYLEIINIYTKILTN